MKYTQMLMLELGHLCNLAKEHGACPTTTRKKVTVGMPLSQIERVAIGSAAYKQHGFRGIIGFHYYNEPMLRAREVFDTMLAIKDEVPMARFILWTNGTITPDDENMRLFDRIVCSNYKDDPSLDSYYRRFAGNVQVNPANGNWAFDGRIEDWHNNGIDNRPCLRPLIEFIVDDWGNGRICCQDWHGDVVLGNVRDEGGFASMLDRRRAMLETICRPMNDNTSKRCRRCSAKAGPVPFDPLIYQDGIVHYQ